MWWRTWMFMWVLTLPGTATVLKLREKRCSNCQLYFPCLSTQLRWKLSQSFRCLLSFHFGVLYSSLLSYAKKDIEIRKQLQCASLRRLSEKHFVASQPNYEPRPHTFVFKSLCYPRDHFGWRLCMKIVKRFFWNPVRNYFILHKVCTMI